MVTGRETDWCPGPFSALNTAGAGKGLPGGFRLEAIGGAVTTRGVGKVVSDSDWDLGDTPVMGR
jgi:hypothetical protein